uniref:Uncharacterized protein n=1 Tax=Lepeophtheirus salmonis TaxID=72036 RepID=A0A0K2VCY2_LEPSM
MRKYSLLNTKGTLKMTDGSPRPSAMFPMCTSPRTLAPSWYWVSSPAQGRSCHHSSPKRRKRQFCCVCGLRSTVLPWVQENVPSPMYGKISLPPATGSRSTKSSFGPTCTISGPLRPGPPTLPIAICWITSSMDIWRLRSAQSTTTAWTA